MSRASRKRPNRHCISFGIAVLSVASWAASSSPAGESPGELVGRLDAAVRHVEAARDRGGPLGDPGAYFPESEEVATGRAAMRVDHGALRAEWAAVPAEAEARRAALDRLRDRLAAARTEMESSRSAGAAVARPLERWRETLTEILSRPEFKKREYEESVLERFLNWLRDKLASLLPEGVQKAAGSLARWIVYTLAAIAILLVLIVLLRAAIPLLGGEVLQAQGGAPATTRTPETPESLLALADARTRTGDYRGALQAIFRWMLLCLHQTGRLDYDPALTNREHLARLKGDGAMRAGFEELSGQFELVWYALRQVDQEGLSTFRARAQALAGGGRT